MPCLDNVRKPLNLLKGAYFHLLKANAPCTVWTKFNWKGMLKMLRFFLFFSLVIIAGCTAPLEVERIGTARIEAEDKSLVMLSRTRYDREIRTAFRRNGFSVKRFSSTKYVTEETSEKRTEEFFKAEASYGIDVYLGRIVDRCMLNKSVKFFEVTFELVDLRLNETVFSVTKGGWSDDCGYHKGKLFNELAAEIRAAWGS